MRGRPIEVVPEMGIVLAALQRGTKRSKLRLTAGVCSKNHTVLEVFRGSDGRLYVAYTWGAKWIESRTWADTLGERYGPGRGQPLDRDGEVCSVAKCSCCDGWSWVVKHRGIQAALDAGIRRFVVDAALPSRKAGARVPG